MLFIFYLYVPIELCMFQGLYLFLAITKLDGDDLKQTLYSGIISTVSGDMFSECIVLSSNVKFCPCNAFHIDLYVLFELCMFQGLILFSAITKMDDALKRTLYSCIISTVSSDM